MLRLHPAILSLSEFFMPIASRAFVGGSMTGEAFWRRLSRPQLSAQRAINPKHCPAEFLYPLAGSTRFDEASLPPILYVTLPHLTDRPDALYDELGAVLRPRGRAPLATHYRFLFEWLCARFGRTTWVERSGGSLVMLPAMHRAFPEAKVVHCHRDGRDVALSIRQHPPMRLLAANWHRYRRFGIDLLRPPFRVGDSRILATLEPLMAPLVNLDRQLEQDLPLEVIGAFWSELVCLGTETLAALPQRQRLEIRYQDLVAKPAAELERLAEFLELDRERAWIEQASALVRGGRSQWRDLPAEERQALAKACQRGLERLDYAA